jgi:AFG3 family protein
MIDITPPDLEARKEIFEVHLEPLAISDERTLEQYAKRLATLTPGFSGSDIAAICNEAAILAARGYKTQVEAIDFEMAVERIIGGMEVSSKSKTDSERRTVAYHECGHGVVSWFLEGGMPL